MILLPSNDYLETVLEKAKEYLPDWLFQEIHKVARAKAGGKQKARNIINNVEKLLLEEMQPETLENAPDDEINQAWLRLNQWYSLAKEENRTTENYINAAIWVLNEMQKRGFNVDEKNELAQEAKKLSTKTTFKKELDNRLNNLPRDIMVVKDFVCIVGSAAAGKPNPDDVDVLFRGNRDEKDNFLVQSDNIWLPVRKALDPQKEGILHFIDNPQGSHADYMSLYDLVLRKKDIIKTEVVKAASEMPGWEKYLDDLPEGEKIDLGSGPNKAKGFKGIDKENFDNVDIMADLDEGIPMDDESVAALRANHSLEHLNNMDDIMNEIHRVLMPGGVAIITIPSTEGIGATIHPDHKLFMNKDTFKKFDKLFKIEHLENRNRGVAVDVDAVLRKPLTITKALEPYKRFIPTKPQMAGYTESFDIAELLKWADNSYPIDIEPKYNGFRSIAEKNGSKTRLWLEGQYGKDQLNKIPNIQSLLSKINEDFIIDTDLGILKDGKRESRPDLMKFNQDNPEFLPNEVPILTVFDILYYREDLTDKPFSERRKILEQFYNKYLKGKKEFSLSPTKWCSNDNEIKVAARWAFNQDKSEGLVAKKAAGIYPLTGGTNDWFKLKRVIELKVKVLDKKETKNAGVYNYWGGLLPGVGDNYTNTKELDGKKYVDLGKTFSSNIKANIGDVITVEVLELIPDEEKNTLAWLGPRVMDIDDTRKEPYSTGQAVSIAERGEVLQKAINSFVPSMGSSNLIAFIGASPSYMESARGEPLISTNGEAFNNLYLKPLGLDRKDVFISNIVPQCITDDHGRIREPNNQEIDQWSSWINKELCSAAPKIIIALGQTAKKALDDIADFVLPHPRALIKHYDSGELNRKLRQIKKALEEGETRGQIAANYWRDNWFKMYPKDGKGRYTYQHHWRGLTEDETKLNEDALLNTNHSVHGDLRLEDGDSLWGFSIFTGTAEANKKAGGDRLITLPQDDNLQGTFKLPQPKEWLSIAHNKPYISEPEGPGATSKSYAKFFEEDFGDYEMGVWREHMIEIFLHGPKLKGRYIIEYAPVGSGQRVWLIDKPKDQTPYSESRKLENVISELKSKGQKYLVWAGPNQKPKLINIGSEKVTKEYYAEIAKADDEKQIVTGIVLEPDSVDAQGDTINADEIEKAAHFFMVKSRTIGDSHKKKAPAELVESYVAPIDFELGKQKVKKGTWIISVKINDPKMWQDVKDSKYTGFSVGGFGVREGVK